MPEHHLVSGVIECTISDHYMTYTVLQHKRGKQGAPKYVTTRDFKHFDPLYYNEDLMDCNLYHTVNNCRNVDDSWESWSSRVLNIMNKHAPLKTYRPSVLSVIKRSVSQSSNGWHGTLFLTT